MSHRCEICKARPTWELVRIGDVMVTWACDGHLAQIATRHQRDFAHTKLTLALYGGTDG